MTKRKKPVVTEYRISSPGLPEEFEGYRMAVLADLHDCVLGEENAELLRTLTDAAPDSILIAGDLITEEKRGRRRVFYENSLSLLRRLCRTWPVFYGMGNHEKRWQEQPLEGRPPFSRWETEVRAAGAVLLDNTTACVSGKNSRIVITGLSLPLEYYISVKDRLKQLTGRKQPVRITAGEISRLCGRPSPDAFQILIAHTPAYAEVYAEWGADLALSGHYHGGMVRLPLLGGVVSPSLELFPKYSRGLFHLGKCRLAVSAGLGNHSIPLRLFNPPELVLLELHRGIPEEDT